MYYTYHQIPTLCSNVICFYTPHSLAASEGPASVNFWDPGEQFMQQTKLAFLYPIAIQDITDLDEDIITDGDEDCKKVFQDQFNSYSDTKFSHSGMLLDFTKW